MNPDVQNTISKDTGVEWTAKWRAQNPNTVNAFLIPAVDFVEVLNEIGVLDDEAAAQAQTNANNLNAHVRGYLAIDGDTEKMIFVGTEKVGDVYKDIIDGTIDGTTPTTLKSAADPTTSGVYDFTDPCPPSCDPNSPLN